jgi:putative ABC transport system ATP-binding protein
MQPLLLLADEPTGNLDTHSGQQIMELLESLNAKGLTMLVVTHDPKVARRANRVIVLADGQIVKRIKGEELTSGSAPFF